MRFIGVTQRVGTSENRERRDQLDQRWIAFLLQCGFTPYPIPNHVRSAESLVRSIACHGILLTGGNNLLDYGGDAPERDETELFLLKHALDRNLPLLGICRGMQLIQHFFGIRLTQVEGHITPTLKITVNGTEREVPSYHRMGTTETTDVLDVWAAAPDGVVKAVRHKTRPIQGLMWHPERIHPFAPPDIEFVREFYTR
ncbi:MAG: gamma-glutamyl-gamma-aminobutyrate hydrolase family protein [Deltaproteobacteria bacterium]|nr:gamma-glutamyl-gamma-aminobutyrate hydrolase family protein [Deltaproteobacteria bacterium]